MRKWKNESLLPENALILIKSPQILRCKRSLDLSVWFFLFYDLYLFLYGYILTVLPITAAANWKLFAFYGKFVRNRPSKKRFCLHSTGELCPVGLCLFFAQSCRMLLFALGVEGSWSGLGRSVIPEYSAFFLPKLILYTPSLKTWYVLWFFCRINQCI